MKLRMKNANRYVVETENYQFEGAWMQVQMHLIKDHGMEPTELDYATEEMFFNGHDTAHFGVNLMFTHTSDSKNLAKIRAELRAIKEVKEELAIEYAKDKDGPGFKYAQKRLLNLSLTIDVDAALKVLGDNEDVLVA